MKIDSKSLRKIANCLNPYFGNSTEIANAICRDATDNLAEGIFVGSRGNRGLTK